MLNQFLVGGLASLINIAIHAVTMSFVVYAAQAASSRLKASPSVLLTGVMSVTAAVLMVSHACEVVVWALIYGIVEAAPPGANRLYFAFVNYTTLGYGDVIPEKAWQLLGPMTAMNGVLLFGWSTAVIFEVLRKTMAAVTRGAR
jgi:hypothetical protein